MTSTIVRVYLPGNLPASTTLQQVATMAYDEAERQGHDVDRTHSIRWGGYGSHLVVEVRVKSEPVEDFDWASVIAPPGVTS